MTPADFGGYTKNPRRTKRNQVDTESQDLNLPAPKFLSEKGKEKDKSYADSDQAISIDGAAGGVRRLFDVPSRYKKVEIKYSRFGVDDFDFEYVVS